MAREERDSLARGEVCALAQRIVSEASDADLARPEVMLQRLRLGGSLQFRAAADLSEVLALDHWYLISSDSAELTLARPTSQARVKERIRVIRDGRCRVDHVLLFDR